MSQNIIEFFKFHFSIHYIRYFSLIKYYYACLLFLFFIGAILVERPADVEEGFPHNAPLVYHYGHTNMDKNTQTFNLLVNKMAEVVHERLQTNRKCKFV